MAMHSTVLFVRSRYWKLEAGWRGESTTNLVDGTPLYKRNINIIIDVVTYYLLDLLV